MEDTGAVVREGKLRTVDSIWSHSHHTHLWKIKGRNTKGYIFTHPMGTVGFHLEIVLECTLTGALEADPAAHAVEHSLNTGYPVGCSSTVEALMRQEDIIGSS